MYPLMWAPQPISPDARNAILNAQDQVCSLHLIRNAHVGNLTVAQHVSSVARHAQPGPRDLRQ